MVAVRIKAVAIAVFVLTGAMFLGTFAWVRATSREAEQANLRGLPSEQKLQSLQSLPQPYSRLLISMDKREPQLGADGTKYPLAQDTGVTVLDGMFIYNLIREVKPERTAEIGLAEGFSTLYFLAALQENGTGVHVAIDPFENSGWHGIGVQKVKEAGMTKRFRFIEQKSNEGLPLLKTERQPYRVIFIDGDHKFDGSFTDFVLSDAICANGCYILLHDAWMPSTQKVAKFIERNRADYARRPVPAGVNIAVFQKVGTDKRDWRQFSDF